ncbi:methionine ABC transporter ATP-binding protein [Aminivibrio sp.]|jgi:D-methionine transport system ATP-binding protein|uniref:methionine ABC transporter ATP-binding protein n=1 Tax=Aminivibrio sp. TaxID=1872489 RepID=UPI001A6105CB|nr:methionine ABC transporter ATP-binding protein [Aminivibrio sp.]MBL3540154.1 methionine ABC transporter ATP-binding protein [Aminivibrio sp.]
MAILLKGVTKTYGAGEKRLKALSNIDLEIPDGSIFGIIGRSGAGKSTLVRCVNLLERPDCGSVAVSGLELTALDEGELRQARKKIGMIFQNFNLLSCRTVFGNVAFPLELAGWRREDIAGRVDELLDLVGLADKRDRYPSQLSGGQKQRVGIARALANRPDVLLSDEATSALDPLTTRSILSLLRDINSRLGLTIVLITHEMNVIREICTDVAVIDKGSIVERGPVLDIFTDPRAEVTLDMLRDVMGVELPETFAGLDFSPGIHGSGDPVLQLQFFGDIAADPVISGMIRRFEVDVNILVARIGHIRNVPCGTLVIRLSGDERAKSGALGYLRALDLKVEVIGHVGSGISVAV